MKKYDTFVFDLDGTLLDTLKDLCDAVNHTLIKHGYPTHTNDEIRGYLGNGMEVLITLSLPNGKNEPNFNQVLQDFKDYYLVHSLDTTGPYKGILEVLGYLKNNNYKFAIVSNKGDLHVKHLNEYFFKDYIDVAIGEKTGIRKKPYPDTVFEALRLLNSSVDTAYYVGDSEVDIDTAKNANMECLVVSWGFRTNEQLIESGAKTIFNNPSELLDFIKNMDK